MTADEFRKEFAKSDHLLLVVRANGERALAVGLNGDCAVLHRDGEIPLTHLRANFFGLVELIDHEDDQW